MKTFESKTITETKQVVVETKCNKCGDVTEDGYAIPVETTGGYSSNAIMDTRHYSFDLCEPCLVVIMNGLKIPPTVIDDSQEMTYQLDREQIAGRISARNKSNNEHAQAQKDGLCSWSRRVNEDDNHSPSIVCRSIPTMTVDGVLTCQRCGLDMYCYDRGIIMRDLNLYPGAKPMTFADRAAVGNQFIADFNTGTVDLIKDVYNNPDGSVIVISTLMCLVSRPKTFELANNLLSVFFELHDENIRWIDCRIPGRFGTDKQAQAKTANAWLRRGQEEGYRNAVTSALLNRSAEEMWEV